MQIPPYLKKGDKIGIVSTASKIDKKVLLEAIDLLKMMGYKIVVGKNVLEQSNQYAGTDIQRKDDLQTMLDDVEIKAIFCSRGGYGTLRTIQNINWETFLNYPKWIVGFSDVTVLHSQLNRLGIASIHGAMLRYFKEDKNPTESFMTLNKALSGNNIEYEISPSAFNKNGKSSGEIVGGNLSILYSLRGTLYDIDTQNKILFIEDLAEYYYHIDRILMNLKAGGKLQHLSGLIVGSFTGMKDNDTPFGKGIEEIILDFVSDYNFPVIFNFPAGHQNKNFALKLGCHSIINASNEKVIFTQK